MKRIQLLSVVMASVWPTVTAAQTLTVVVSNSEGSTDSLEALAVRVDEELRRQGEPLVSRSEASTRLEARHSKPARHMSAAEQEWIAERSEAALLLVATGRARDALAAGEQLMQRVESSLDVVNRDDAVATQLFNGCLFAVRAALTLEEDARARALAAQCVRFAPDLSPDASVHPPEVLAADRAVRSEVETRGALLTVIAAEARCPVRVNGRSLGQTPVSVRVPPGTYSIQLACPEHPPGRVYSVTADSDESRVSIDPHVDRVLVTRPHLRFQAGQFNAGVRRQLSLSVGRLVGASRVWLISHDEGGARHDVLDISSERELTAVRTALRPSAEEVAETVRFFLSEPPPATSDGDQDAPTPVASRGGPRTGSRGTVEEPESSPPWFGWALAGVGVASFGASVVGYSLTLSREDQLDAAAPSDIDYQDRVDRLYVARGLTVGTAAAGAVLVTSSLPLLLPSEEGVPWWSWVFGGVGAAAAAVGVAVAAQSGECLGLSACFNREQPWVLGSLLIASGVPLIAVPLVYALRQALGNDIQTSVEASESELRMAFGIHL